MNKNKNKMKSLASMIPLFLVLFIDAMGLGLLFPIFNKMLIDPNFGFLPPTTSELLRSFYYGLVIGVFMLCWFLGSAILGDLSDSIGRKKSLMFCLIGAFLGYLLSAIAMLCRSFSLLLLGRVIAGFTAGSQPIAQAAIVDISTEEEKSRNIGFILLSTALGFVFGPIFGGLLSNSQLVSWFNFTVPMYFAAGLSLFNAFILSVSFQETLLRTKEKVAIQWNHGFQIFMSAFKHASIQRYSLVLLVMVFGWANYFTFIPLYLLETHQYTVMQTSFYFSFLGLGFTLGCGYATPIVSKSFHLDNIVIMGLMVTALQIVLFLWFPEEWVLWLATAIIGLCLSVAYSVLLTIFSNQVGDAEQGWVMGVTGSILPLGFGITCILTGIVAHMGVRLPMLLAALGFFLAAIILVFVRKKND